MASKTLYLYKTVSEGHQSICSGGEFSVTSDSNSSSATRVAAISSWVDATAIADLDIKTINSVTMSYQCKATTNNSINYAYLEYKIKPSGVDEYKVDETRTSNFPTSYTPRTHDMASWTKDELCAGDGAHIYLNVYMAVPWLTTSTAYLKDVKLIVDYTLNSYGITVRANDTAGGIVTGTGTYESGTRVTISATPNEGYRFVKWSDGNTSATRTVTALGNATYTAEFIPLAYVTYDSIMNFQKWKDEGITVTNGVASNITDTGLTLTTNADKTSSRTSSPFFPVEYGKSYKIDIDIVGVDWTVYIFFCDADENRIDFKDSTHKFNSSGTGVPSRIFTAPDNPSVVQAQIRLDCRGGGGGTATYHNFRIFPAEYEYMSNTVDESERVDYGLWSIPTPTRSGYEFIGWNTEPDGSGTVYTPASAFPTADMTLYSQWKEALKIFNGIKKLSVYCGTLKIPTYCGTQKLT